jgi:hypothetical protein
MSVYTPMRSLNPSSYVRSLGTRGHVIHCDSATRMCRFRSRILCRRAIAEPCAHVGLRLLGKAAEPIFDQTTNLSPVGSVDSIQKLRQRFEGGRRGRIGSGAVVEHRHRKRLRAARGPTGSRGVQRPNWLRRRPKRAQSLRYPRRAGLGHRTRGPERRLSAPRNAHRTAHMPVIPASGVSNTGCSFGCVIIQRPLPCRWRTASPELQLSQGDPDRDYEHRWSTEPTGMCRTRMGYGRGGCRCWMRAMTSVAVRVPRPERRAVMTGPTTD